MSTHKTGKYRNLIQQSGILRLNTGKSATATPGLVAEYTDSGSTKYTGLVRKTGETGAYYELFDGLTDNPFAPDANGVVAQNQVGSTGATAAALKVGTLNTSQDLSVAGNAAVSGTLNTLGNISTQGGVAIAGADSSNKGLWVANDTYLGQNLEVVGNASVSGLTASGNISAQGFVDITGSGAPWPSNGDSSSDLIGLHVAASIVTDSTLEAIEVNTQNINSSTIYATTGLTVSDVTTLGPAELSLRNQDLRIVANYVNQTQSIIGKNAMTIRTGSGSNITLGGTGNQVLLNADPTAALGAATKQYVDNLAQGLSAKQECRVRTVSDLASLSGGVVLTGSAATRTITRGQVGDISGDAAAFDGVSLSLNDRVLVMMQSASSDNGIYYVMSAGDASTPWSLRRALDFNSSTDVVNGAYTFVNQGTVWQTTGWVMNSSNPITLETTALTWVQFSQIGVVSGNNLDNAAVNVFKDKTGDLLNFRGMLFSNTVDSNTTDALEVTQSASNISFNLDTKKITKVGALNVGSIASGFGSISTSNAITTTDTVTGATVRTTGGALSATGSVLSFAGSSGSNALSMPDNTANALTFKDGSSDYLQFSTATGAKSVSVEQMLKLDQGTLKFAASSGSNLVNIPSGAANALDFVDADAQSYMQFQSVAGSKQIQFNVPVNLTQPLNLSGDAYLSGGFREGVKTVTGAYSLASLDNIVNVIAGSSDVTITLPDAASNEGRNYKIRKQDSGAGSVVVGTLSGGYIDGVLNDTLVLDAQHDHCYLVSHGSAGWFIY